MAKQPGPLKDVQDFTVEVSMKEKTLTSLLFAFGMGGLIYFARKYALEHAFPSIYFNLSFALAVFGVVRMLRTIFQENRKGLIATPQGLQVVTLFSQPEIPYSDLRETSVAISDRPANEVTFRWGQFRYRLPCSDIDKLSSLLNSHNIPVVFGESTGTLKDAAQRLQNKTPQKYRIQRPPGTVLMALIFWAVGVVAMFYTAKL